MAEHDEENKRLTDEQEGASVEPKKLQRLVYSLQRKNEELKARNTSSEEKIKQLEVEFFRSLKVIDEINKKMILISAIVQAKEALKDTQIFKKRDCEES
jgi:cell division protein FtsB